MKLHFQIKDKIAKNAQYSAARCNETVTCIPKLFLEHVIYPEPVDKAFLMRNAARGLDQQTACFLWKCDYCISFTSDLYYLARLACLPSGAYMFCCCSFSMFLMVPLGDQLSQIIQNQSSPNIRDW